MSDDGIFCACHHCFEKISRFRDFFDKFPQLEGRYAWDVVNAWPDFTLFLLVDLNFILLITGRFYILLRFGFLEDSLYELHSDHFAFFLRVGVWHTLLELTSLEGEFLVVALFLLFDQMLDIVLACHFLRLTQPAFLQEGYLSCCFVESLKYLVLDFFLFILHQVLYRLSESLH